MHVLPLRRFVAGTLVFLFPLTALAATRTWDAGGSDTNWSTAANWSSDTAPTATDIALFDGTGKKDATVDAGFGGSVAQLQLGSSNTGTITVSRALTVNGNLSLSGGTFAINGGNTVTVQKSWQNGGGTFTANTGSVVLTGSGTSYVLKETGAFKHLSLNDGLVGYWRLDEGAGTTVTESMGNVVPGIFELNPVWTSETPVVNFENPYSLLFNATPQQRVLLEDTSSPYRYDIQTGDMTVSVWAKKTDASNGGRIIARDQCGDHSLWEIQGNADGTYHVRMKGSNYASSGNIYSSVHPINEWLMLTLVKTSTRISIYVNGILEGTATHSLPFAFSNTQAKLYVGNRSGCQPGAAFAGYIDDIRLYTRALSSSEVAALASGEQGTGSGTYTLGSNLTVNGNLNIYSGNLDVSSSNYSVTASGSFINSARFTPRSGTVTLAGIGTTLKMYGTSLYNLTIASAKSAILRTAAIVTNALTVASSAALNLNGFDLTATLASISNLGTITEGTGAILHTSSLAASPAALDIGSSISISLTDSDANVDGTAQDTVTVTANGETVTLTETTNTSGVFTGSIATAHGAGVASNGVIENTDACSFF
ncbi:MAG: LamG-like jellyroll fold domain-containing protein, partial [Patescibacteria group bacterium]